MGDHICGKAPPSPKAQPASMANPFTLRQLNANGHNAVHAPSPLQYSQAAPQTRVRAPTVNSHHVPFAPRPSRTAPPRIDPGVANKPFLAPKPPRSDSPISPAISTRSASSSGSRPPPIRSMTSPAPRIFDPRPPSPEMSCNLDCAFPPFPAPSSSGSRPGTSNGRGTPSGSERAPSRGASSRQEGRFGSGDEVFGLEPRSPRGTENVMQRMDALKSGPFDGSRRRPSDNERTVQGSHPLDRRRPSMPNITFDQPPPVPSEPLPRPSTSHSNQPPSQRPTTSSNNFSRPGAPTSQQKDAPPRPQRPNEDVIPPRFLDNLSSEPVQEMPSTFSPSQPPLPLKSSDRSRTFPMRQESTDEPTPTHTLSKTPSQPEMRGRPRRPTLTAASQSEPFQIPQAAQLPSSQSRGGARVDHRMYDAPPVPRPVQQHRQDSMHTPSDSGSSTNSSANSVSNSNTSGPSPVASAASSVDVMSPLSYEPNAYGEDEKMRVAGLNVRVQNQQKPGMRAEQPKQRSPPRNFARPGPAKELPPPQELLPSPPATRGIDTPLESPMDPAMQNRRLGNGPSQALQLPREQQQQRPSLNRTQTAPESRQVQPESQVPALPSLAVPTYHDDEYDPYRPLPEIRARSKSNAASQYQAFKPTTQAQPSPQQAMPPPPPIPQEPSQHRPLARRGTVAKTPCRGCGMVIEGKSVKAADGRLTGRWHKACFTCKTCEQPFTTADFYVISNQPYCEQHYHEKNGSLCHGCNKGIEGQYLETTSSSAAGSVDRKFHPRCFTCHDCREVLSDDYFEISGKVFCERHALAAMRGQARMAGPGLNPVDRRGLMAERRTTKLMMM